MRPARNGLGWKIIMMMIRNRYRPGMIQMKWSSLKRRTWVTSVKNRHLVYSQRRWKLQNPSSLSVGFVCSVNSLLQALGHPSHYNMVLTTQLCPFLYMDAWQYYHTLLLYWCWLLGHFRKHWKNYTWGQTR